MKSILIAVLALSLAQVVSAKPDEPASAAELKIINQFSDRLFALVRQKNLKDYIGLFALSDDHWRNLKTGKAAEIPVNFDAEEQQALAEQFLSAIADAEKTLGKWSGITLSRIEYWIRRDPHDKQFGIFVFDVTLVLEGNRKMVRLWQPSCVLGMRGVLIGDGLRMRTSTDQ